MRCSRAPDVDRSPASSAQTGAVSKPLSRDVKCGSVIGTGPHNRQSSGKVYPFSKGQTLEWNEPLVVVHRQHAIKFLVAAGPEETVCTEGAVDR